jgi:hypothetical protein
MRRAKKVPKSERPDKPKFHIIYVYATKENKDFISAISARFGQPATHILNSLIEAARRGERLSLKHHIPPYVKRAEAWTARHLAKKR